MYNVILLNDFNLNNLYNINKEHFYLNFNQNFEYI